MQIQWLGTATVRIRKEHTVLLFDPYLKKYNPALPRIAERDLRENNAIFITHPHVDHLADIGEVMAVCPAPVYVCARGIENAKSVGTNTENMHAIACGETRTIGSLAVTAHQGRHCHFDAKTIIGARSRIRSTKALRQFTALAREMRTYGMHADDIFAYTITDGEKTILLLGSAGLAEKSDLPKSADLMVFPFQGRSNMSAYAAKIFARLDPKSVLLDHFDDAFPPLSTTVDASALLARDKRVRLPEFGKWYDVE